jgi:hypothetical protein
VHAIVRDPFLAEDTFSDVTLEIARSWDRFDPTRPFEPWARGLARRVALANLRKHNRPVRGLDADRFLVRWTGLLEPRFSERHTFELVADDGVRLWVDGQLLVDQWGLKSQQTKMRGEMALVAGRKYALKLDYSENTGKAFVSLYWQSESQPREIVPQSQLYPPDTNAVRSASKP